MTPYQLETALRSQMRERFEEGVVNAVACSVAVDALVVRVHRAEAQRDEALKALRYANDRLVPLESELHRVKADHAAEMLAANERIQSLESHLQALARASNHLALATPDRVLRQELERAVKLANEVLPEKKRGQ